MTRLEAAIEAAHFAKPTMERAVTTTFLARSLEQAEQGLYSALHNTCKAENEGEGAESLQDTLMAAEKAVHAAREAFTTGADDYLRVAAHEQNAFKGYLKAVVEAPKNHAKNIAPFIK